MTEAYQPDRSLKGKLRRRLVRLQARRPATAGPRRATVSFTFDDPPATAVSTGAEVLGQHQAMGTYFVSAGLLGGQGPMGAYASWPDIQRLAAQGHEIACHTYSHLDCGQAAGAQAVADADRNLAAFAAHALPAPATFAYPYGDVSHGPKQALAGRYGLLRALHHGVIERGTDLNQAPAVGIEGSDGEATALAWMRTAAQRGAWLILYTHDVCDAPSSWGCTPAALDRLVRAANALGMDIVTADRGAAMVSRTSPPG